MWPYELAVVFKRKTRLMQYIKQTMAILDSLARRIDSQVVQQVEIMTRHCNTLERYLNEQTKRYMDLLKQEEYSIDNSNSLNELIEYYKSKIAKTKNQNERRYYESLANKHAESYNFYKDRFLEARKEQECIEDMLSNYKNLVKPIKERYKMEEKERKSKLEKETKIESYKANHVKSRRGTKKDCQEIKRCRTKKQEKDTAWVG
ncbi:MAG: hypothetical protein QXK37_02720 [Candidatus Woesearchaeota archaeon]